MSSIVMSFSNVECRSLMSEVMPWIYFHRSWIIFLARGPNTCVLADQPLKFPHSADPQKWPQDLATRPPKNQLAIQDRGRYIFPFVHNKSHTFSFAASAWEYEKSSEIVSIINGETKA